MSVKISRQWLVKNNTAFQQTVIKNTGSSPIEDFSILVLQNMLIRDLDYLDDPSYNNEGSDDYIRGRGPGEFSWVTANFLGNEKSVTTRGKDVSSDHTNLASEIDEEGDKLKSDGGTKGTPQDKQPPHSSKLSCGKYVRPHTTTAEADSQHHLSSGDVQAGGMEDISTDQHQTGAKHHDNVEKRGQSSNEAKHPPSDDELWQKRCISDTWSQDSHAVVCIMSLYVNGTAQKMAWEGGPIHKTIGAAGSGSNVLELTVAYRLIAIPKTKVHWKNFLIPAAMADVSAMLAAETEQIWGHSVTDDCECSQSLCDLGLSMVDLSKCNARKDASGKRQTSQDPGSANLGVQESMPAQEETTISSNSQEQVKTELQEAPTASDPYEKHDAVRDKSARPITDATVVTSQKLSPINSAIEYLMWRHTENILSVCTIPLTSQILSCEEEAHGLSSPRDLGANDLGLLRTAKGQRFDLEVPLALTCGDMSGHRICTSASL